MSGCRQISRNTPLTQSQPLPVYPDQRTSSDRHGWSGSCPTTRLMHRSNDEAMCPHSGRPAAYKARVVISSRSFGPEPRERAPERRLPCRGFKQNQLLCLAMSADRLSDRFRQSSQISISVPSSTTCLAGTPKKVAEPLALCCRNAKRVSRQTAMPTTSSLGMIFSRPT